MGSRSGDERENVPQGMKSREGGKKGEERQHEDREHLQDTGKGQTEIGFAKDDRRGKRGNQNQQTPRTAIQ